VKKEHVLATEEYLATGSKTKAPDMGADRKGCTQSRMDCNDNLVCRTFKDCSIHVKTMKRSSQRALRDRELFQKSYSKGHWSHIALESIVPASSWLLEFTLEACSGKHFTDLDSPNEVTCSEVTGNKSHQPVYHVQNGYHLTHTWWINKKLSQAWNFRWWRLGTWAECTIPTVESSRAMAMDIWSY
jgi:hypothetical protein